MSLAKVSQVYFPESKMCLFLLKGTSFFFLENSRVKVCIVGVFSQKSSSVLTDGSISLCSWWKTFNPPSSPPPVCNKGSPNKLLSCWFPTTFNPSNFGTWLSSCQRGFLSLFFRKEFPIVSPLVFLNGATCFSRSPSQRNVCFTLSLISCLLCYRWP